MTVIDGVDLDRTLAARLDPRAAALLGLSETEAQMWRWRTKPWMRIVRHRVLALLATLRVVEVRRPDERSSDRAVL